MHVECGERRLSTSGQLRSQEKRREGRKKRGKGGGGFTLPMSMTNSLLLIVSDLGKENTKG